MEYSQSDFRASCERIRRTILSLCFKAGGGNHFGPSFSIVELLNYIYHFRIDFAKLHDLDIDRDRFILSKGHAVLALFATLNEHGIIDSDTLSTYKTSESSLIAHPVRNLLLGIESTNGSLGHGLSYGVGLALGLKRRRLAGRVYVIIGDGECNEGSIWEALMTAVHNKLDNLYCIVDQNGFQSDDSTSSVTSAVNLTSQLASFGCQTISLDGHSFEDISRAFQDSDLSVDRPHFLVAKTIKGKGVSFMEANNIWHHNTLSIQQYHDALAELSIFS